MFSMTCYICITMWMRVHYYDVIIVIVDHVSYSQLRIWKSVMA